MTIREVRHLWRAYSIEAWTLVVGIVAMNAIFISKAFRQGSTVDPATAGQLGDFVGGYVGAFLSLLGVVLLVATLRSQLRTSEGQSFEGKYFELIRLHRDNVAEIELLGAIGRRLFVLMVREFRGALGIVKSTAESLKVPLTQEQACHVAYFCVYFGVGPDSSRLLLGSLLSFKPEFVSAVEKKLNDPSTKKQVQKERKLNFTPFEGHQYRLGHYYRHLYQMVRYVDQTTHIDDQAKYEYVKTIRAQLSTHEQALLFINSRTPLGKEWWRKDLILPYRLVQNIPRDFFRADEIDMLPLFPRGYFEWEEYIDRDDHGG